MTRIKEKAVEMIQRMPDDDMFYVINILQNLEEMTARKDTLLILKIVCRSSAR